MTAIDQKADEYAYNEWRDFSEEQAIARRGFKAGAEYVLKLYESGNTKAKGYVSKLVETALKGGGVITKEELEEMREFINDGGKK